MDLRSVVFVCKISQALGLKVAGTTLLVVDKSYNFVLLEVNTCALITFGSNYIFPIIHSRRRKNFKITIKHDRHFEIQGQFLCITIKTNPI